MKIRKATKKDFEGYFKLENKYREFENKLAPVKDYKARLVKSEIHKNFLRKLKKKDNKRITHERGKHR